MAIIPIAVVGIIVSNASGLRLAITNIIESIGIHKPISSTIIAFNDANIFYGMHSPVSFIFDTMAMFVVDILRRLTPWPCSWSISCGDLAYS